MKKSSVAIISFFLLVIGLNVNLIAQNFVLSGLVMDQENKKHLSFVKIEVNDNKSNTTTDINGLFTIRSEEPIRKLRVVNIGYQSLIIDATDITSPLIIKLVQVKQSSEMSSEEKSDIYHYIDSVMHIDQYAQIKRRQEAMLSGEIPIGFFSLDMSKLKRYNQFEGVYLGLGGHTNKKLSETVSLGGFTGYGFKDRKTKYGFNVSLWPVKDQRLTLNAGYSYDTQESGGGEFFDAKSEILDPAAFRSFYVSKMNYEQKLRLSASFKQNNFLFYGALQRRIIDRGYDISNGVKILVPTHFNVSGIIAGVRLSTVMTDPKKSIYPVMWFQLTRGIPDMFNGEFNYNRFEGKIQISQIINHLGISSLQVFGNMLSGNAPWFEYFNGRGSYGNFGLFASGSFVTMHPDEFMNERSLSFFYTHTFGNLFPKMELFNPCPALVFNCGWGKIQNNPASYFLPIKDMHRGFIEAGVQLNNLLDLKVYGVGLGAYYRMGAYRNSTFKENLVFKLVISFP